MFSEAQEIIIDRFKHPLFSGSLEEQKQSADGINEVCGDEVHIEIQLENGVLQKIRHTSRACAICSASADLLAEKLEGESVSTLTSLTAEQIQEMLTIPLSPVRLKCALLPLETLRLALKIDSNS